jgi:enoyl-CoA hydratase/carnithine racemase
VRGSSPDLHRVVGYARALDLCATARWVDAAEAAALGLVTRSTTVEGLLPAALELCAEVLANHTEAVWSVKQLLVGAAQREFAAQNQAERNLQVPLLRALAAALH